MTRAWLSTFLTICIYAADYTAPAGTKPAVARRGQPSILPGGRIIAPAGRQFSTGPGPYGLAVSPDHTTVVSVNSGLERFSVSVIEPEKREAGTRNFVARRSSSGEADQWRSVFMGVAFAGNRSVYAFD